MGVQYDIHKHNIIALTVLNYNIMVYNIINVISEHFLNIKSLLQRFT